METQVNKVTNIVFNAEPPRNINPWQHKWKTVFTSEKGSVLSIPGFYNGDNQWLTRWSPTEEGEWIYQTYSSLPELNGITGKFTVNKAEKTNLSVIIDPKDPTKLSWSDGSPYFLIGFECDWLSLLDHEKEDIPTAKGLINAMRENGFNHVVMNVYARDVQWPWVEGRNTVHDYTNPPLWPFGGTWDKPDYSSMNPAFFHKLDQVMDELQKQKIISHLMIYVWNKNVPWPEHASPEDNTYFDYVVARYQAYSNIVWDISKEALLYGSCTADYITERCRRLKKQDSYKRLMTVHDRKYCEEYTGEVDIISTQTWANDLYTNMKDLAQGYKTKPVYNIEHGGYEECQYNVFPGDYANAEVCLERNYQCIFAGVYSTYYWQGCSWNIVIPEIENLEGKDRPKLEYFKYMADFFEKYPFSGYKVPEKNMGSSGFYLYNEEEKTILVYKSTGNYASHMGTGQASLFKGSVPKEQVWYNTLTGEFKTIPSIKADFLELRSPWGDGPAICVIRW
jgi:hypothetical protein